MSAQQHKSTSTASTEHTSSAATASGSSDQDLYGNQAVASWSDTGTASSSELAEGEAAYRAEQDEKYAQLQASWNRLCAEAQGAALELHGVTADQGISTELFASLVADGQAHQARLDALEDRMHAYEAEIQGVMNAVCEVEAGQRQDEIDDLEAQLAVKQDWLESWEFQASECMPSARRGNPVQSGQVGYCMGTLSNIQTKYREIEELRARIAEVKNRPPEDDFCE